MYLEVKNVTKEIGSDIVLKNINISMERGHIYGIEGKNGCGKSMLMRVISGFVFPTEGSVMINGKFIGKDISFPESAGIIIENPGFLGSYSGFENLKILASIKNKITDEDIINALQRVNLEDAKNKKFRKYSLGMKQKLGIAAAIMEKPELLIFDEPTNALDEKSEELFWNIVKEEKQRGALIIISCHDSDALTEISDHIFKMDKGQIVEGQ